MNGQNSLAGQVHQMTMNYLITLDKDRNKVITYPEVYTYFVSQKSMNPRYSADVFFSSFDKDRNGVITYAEINKNLLDRENQRVEKVAVDVANDIMKKLDKNKDGKIGWYEVLEEVKKNPNCKDAYNDAKTIFNLYGTDDNTTLTADEIKQKFQNIFNYDPQRMVYVEQQLAKSNSAPQQ